ncbi:hypothetical protein KC317_g23012, partial [Hortaea werneckii]
MAAPAATSSSDENLPQTTSYEESSPFPTDAGAQSPDVNNGGRPSRQSKMHENDAIKSFQTNRPQSSRQSTMPDPNKLKRDEFVMDTNNSSIVSKRSVEKLYYANGNGEPEYFRYFVSKFKRRSPLINRGYWLRMKAVEHTVTRFLAEQTAKKKVVINLGCG